MSCLDTVFPFLFKFTIHSNKKREKELGKNFASSLWA